MKKIFTWPLSVLHVKWGFCYLSFFALLVACKTKSLEPASLAALKSNIVPCGTVQLAEGCGDKKLDSFIAYGIALVHHMTFDEAEKVFDEVRQADPDCFWGHWGKALTFIHPLWPDAPDEAHLKSGLALASKAVNIASTAREKALGAALFSFYENGLGKTQKERLKSYEQAWAKAYQQLPNDQEIKAFYALSLIATADPADKTYAQQKKAGALMEEVLQVIPDHPGGFHYIIHAYDYPELAQQALQAAAKYDNIAPEVAHALHMPTHIYTRLGMWPQSIEWNLRSASTAFKNSQGGTKSMHYFHALDYLVYAYLQRGEDEKAAKIVDDIHRLKGPFQAHASAAYALAAAEARLALERQQWEKAANLKPRQPNHFDWDKYPEFEAHTYFAIGLGAARSNNLAKATAALQNMNRLQQKVANSYWKAQIDIQKGSIEAWMEFAKNNKKEALDKMQLAAQQEAATNKHAVTPGELLPASELLGDMLLAMNKPSEAIAQYEAALKRSPGRLNSIAHAVVAAKRAGATDKEKYYTTLLAQLKAPLTKDVAALQ
jgi:tetratricopeptide (TPR) repeat protein